jgi:hypothetical protein
VALAHACASFTVKICLDAQETGDGSGFVANSKTARGVERVDDLADRFRAIGNGSEGARVCASLGNRDCDGPACVSIPTDRVTLAVTGSLHVQHRVRGHHGSNVTYDLAKASGPLHAD